MAKYEQIFVYILSIIHIFPHAAWDNLRISLSGFKLLCQDFLSRYSGYYIVPLRVSGSAVETLFSQFK